MRPKALCRTPLALVLTLAAACGPGAPGGPRAPAPQAAGQIASAPAANDGVPVAAPPDSVDIFAAATLARVADSLGASTGKEVGTRPGLRYLQGRRTVTGGSEVHDRLIDVVFVQAGRARLMSGGALAPRRAAGAGEWRGDSIVGGRARPVGPGDFLMIPAGLPHQYLIAPGDSLRYLTIKVEKER